MAPDRPDPPRGGVGRAVFDRTADRGVAERSPALPGRRGRRAGGTGRRQAAGTAARPGQGAGAGAGHALARARARPHCPPRSGTDLHAQARELLAGRDIAVPAAFTREQMRQLSAAGDPRLARAAESAEDGQVIQFLAGAPELLARYRNAPPAAGTLIRAAMDARRLGMGIALSLAFLQAAVPGYLTDTDWDGLGNDWLEQALAWTAAPAKGIHGPLTRIRPRHAADGGGTASGPAYRLADYLEPPCPPRPHPPGRILGRGSPLRQPRRPAHPRQLRRRPQAAA